MKKAVVLVPGEGLGSVGPSDRRFAIEMFDRFLHALESRPEKPAAICLFTDGVKLAVAPSTIAPSLTLLQGMGVRLLVCRTCLEHFGLLDRLAAGEVSTMNEIVTTILEADTVVTV